MATTMIEYRHQIQNQSGYVIEAPSVAATDELLQTMPPNPYAESVTQLFPLGTKMTNGERVFRYCKNAAVALALATPLQSAAAIHAEADDDIVVGAASAIGATTVTLTSTTNLAAAPLSTKDGFKEGYLVVNDLAGEGQLYKIKGHAAASGTSNFVVTLYDSLTIALTTASQVGLIQNPYSNVVVTVAVLTGMFVGVALLAITASYYFWAQTGGPAPGKVNGTLAIGTPVRAGAVAAKFSPLNTDYATSPVVGQVLTPGVTDTETCIIFLTGDR